MRTEEIGENSEDCCYIIGAYNWIYWLSSFKLILLIDCIEFPVHYVCFLHSLFQSELKQGALGLCSLFTFKQAFGQLQ